MGIIIIIIIIIITVESDSERIYIWRSYGHGVSCFLTQRVYLLVV